MEAFDELVRGRMALAAREWAVAVEALRGADGREPLGPADLELLATALFMVNRIEDHLATLERAHNAYLTAGDQLHAGSCAFWIGMRLFMSGEVGLGGGWLARAERLIEQAPEDCVERGYLQLPELYRRQAAGDIDGALRAATAAADVGRACADPDLVALATHAHGRLLIEREELRAGLKLLDEALLAVASGAVSPIPTGIVYCGAIDGCRIAFEPRRAQEWTDALSEWCDSQPEMLAFTGDCHVHRGELMQLHGDWDQALAEFDRAAQRAERAGNARVSARAAYERGEILRLRGEAAGAERAYREAARGGCEPQPGLALLRLAEGDRAAAEAAIRRVLEETADPARRGALLPACVEILLGVGDLAGALAACDELDALAAVRASELLSAHAAHARGAATLAAGDPGDALPHLRHALGAWQDLGAPYLAARVRLLVADACAALGDEESGRTESETARDVLSALGAAQAAERDTYGLTERELEVLRLVAAGHTNRAIAQSLVLSERTIDRHVSNILAKLRVSSRAAATAFAYEHELL